MKDNATDNAREEIFIPRGAANEEPNFFVSVGGINYVLPRGKTSSVPAHVAEEIKRSWAAQEKLDATVEKLLAESHKPLAQ